MIDKKTFKKAIARSFEKSGLVKKGQSWYFDGKEALIVINLQKSNWGEMYHMNLGIWLKAFGEVSFPQFNHCPLYYRVEYFFPKRRELILLGCSLDQSTLPMLAELTEFIESELIPFLQSCSVISKLRELMKQGALDGGFVTSEARMYLSETYEFTS
jgi:hypothetical protein